MGCTDKNSLIREGTSQLNRVLAALDVYYANIDERNTADLILFAKRYAQYLKFYNESNEYIGDWQPLMMMDESVTLATLAKIDTQRISDYKKLLYKKIIIATADSDAQKYFKFLFNALFSLVKIIDEQVGLLPNDDYKKIIQDILKDKKQSSLANLEEIFFKPFKAQLVSFSAKDAEAPLEAEDQKNFERNKLLNSWKSAAPDIPVITIPATITVIREKIIYIVNHNLFNNAIDSLLKSAAQIVSRSKDLFEKTLQDFPQHLPHYALFLTFTKLFKIAQNDLNRYTQKHLNFYYKDVLRLKNKNPVPDKAHLTFELQKNVQQELLKKDILLKGGKDITGKEISYRLTGDVVLNKATVSKIHAQQIDLANNGPLKTFLIANSEDGEGAKLISPDKSWCTFGNSKVAPTNKAGFAIASNILFLNEGTRTITVTVTFSGVEDLKSSEYKRAYFYAKLTGKKDWHSIDNLTGVPEKNTLTFTLILKASDPAIIPYTEKIHKENFEIELPLLKIYLKQSLENSIPYTVLTNNAIDNIKIDVDVKGVKDLMLSNDKGTIDASKPFKPFGDFPDEGAGFYIGSREIFQKNLNSIDYIFEWKLNEPDNGLLNYFPKEVKYLSQSIWDKVSFTNFPNAAVSFEKNEPLSAGSYEGFLKLIFDLPNFSSNDYLQSINKALSNTTISLDPDHTTLKYDVHIEPTPPIPEVITNTFSLNYRATQYINFANDVNINNDLLFHLTPFGYCRLSNASDKLTLLSDIKNSGELMIGFENAEPSTAVTVLFQVADGSSNPLADMETLNWCYLSDNTWKTLEKKNVIDRTQNFTQPGIVTISLPPDITNQNTLLEKGLYWIKAAVKENIDAVCRMILIQAQAAAVELLQDENNQVEFRKTIPANTISKLIWSNAAVKTITQPFDSFDGKVWETDEHFYVRVSERLRHKQRAITIWDYEHIVLEQFPQLYKVKCLNHSGFYEHNNGTNIFCENFPGHVTIVTIPDLKDNAHANMLRPNTPISIINSINTNLQKLTSPFVRPFIKPVEKPFVKLHVTNPQFEEIQLSFNVKFYDGYDESFYTQLLNKEIEKFLCPWAYDTNAEIPFGSKIIRSVLLNFVEERPYVDFVTCFKMSHFIIDDDDNRSMQGSDVEEAIATTSRSVLVSYFDKPDTRHIIKPVDTCDC